MVVQIIIQKFSEFKEYEKYCKIVLYNYANTRTAVNLYNYNIICMQGRFSFILLAEIIEFGFAFR